MRGCGRIGRPAFPAPLFSEGRSVGKARANCAAGRRGCVWNRDVDANTLVMPGHVPGIHVLLPDTGDKDIDGRVKPGHDEGSRHCEERKRRSIPLFLFVRAGLLRFARNDDP